MRNAIEWARDTTYDLWQLLHPAKSEEVQRAWQHWQRPQPGWIKCNVDASFHAEDRRGATGVVLRNHDGRYIVGRAKWYDNCLNVLATEALACRDGVLLARELGMQRLQLETDSQVLVRLWEKRLCQNSEIGPVFQQIQDLSRSFVEFSFVYSSRECNTLAHECAKLVSRNNLVEWLEPPPGLWGIMEAECNPSYDI
jgi:ribonuclease HI